VKLLLASLLLSGALQASWAGQRIVMLRGYGEVHHADADRARTAVGINIVAPVVRAEGNRVWVSSTGEDDSGWLDVRDAIPLSEAIPYFTAIIERESQRLGRVFAAGRGQPRTQSARGGRARLHEGD